MNRLVSDFTDKFAISQSDAGNLVAYHSSRLMRTELGECTRNSSGVCDYIVIAYMYTARAGTAGVGLWGRHVDLVP